ncbi:baseplate complex protein [Pantoea sp. y20]
MPDTTLFALDGKGVWMDQLLVSPSMQFKEQDQSGQTSSTVNSEQGIKAKTLRVTGQIAFDNEEHLQSIFEMAVATDKSGKLKTYRVAHPTATIIKFREGTFTGEVAAIPQTDLLVWQVSFTLREKVSVPEKREARKGNQTGATKQNGSGTGGAAQEDDTEMTWFEKKVLKPINDKLG